MHLLEDRLKKANEEADSENTLRQVAESTFQEKNREVAQVEKKLATVERVQASTDYKVGVLQGKIKESDTKLA